MTLKKIRRYEWISPTKSLIITFKVDYVVDYIVDIIIIIIV